MIDQAEELRATGRAIEADNLENRIGRETDDLIAERDEIDEEFEEVLIPSKTMTHANFDREIFTKSKLTRTQQLAKSKAIESDITKSTQWVYKTNQFKPLL